MSIIKQWWPSIIAAAVALWAAFGMGIQGYISSHPSIAAAIAAVYVIIAHLMPSPAAPPTA